MNVPPQNDPRPPIPPKHPSDPNPAGDPNQTRDPNQTGDPNQPTYPGTPGDAAIPSPPEMDMSGRTQPSPVAATATVGQVPPMRRATSEKFLPIADLYQAIETEIHRLFVGQEELIVGTLTALFAGGHVLIESVPGLGKTLFVRTLGKVLGCECGRIQFTADLMPSDITGAPVFDMQKSEFRFRAGPVFTQFLLADEINRSPAKTHASLLEIMQEYRVTVDGTSHEVPRPFLVLATQNPLESEGTYNLPEAQLDRFMFKLKVDYPSADQEADILRMHSKQVDLNDRLEKEVATVADPQKIMSAIELCSQVTVQDNLVDYINQIVRATRSWPAFHVGASPRAGLTLMQTARVQAAIAGRDFATPDDVVEVVLPALRHRVTVTAEAEIEGRHVDEELSHLIQTVEVPRD